MFNYLSKVNPLLKFVAALVLAILLTFTSDVMLNLIAYVGCIILLVTGSRKHIAALKFSIPIYVMALGLYINGAHFGAGQGSGLLLASRVVAFSGFAMIFSLTTEPHDFVKSLLKDAKLPRKFAYGILCAYNMIPYIRNEYNNAKLAMAVRGVGFSVFSTKPLFAMLVNSIRWSEMMSVAMQSKGFDAE